MATGSPLVRAGLGASLVLLALAVVASLHRPVSLLGDESNAYLPAPGYAFTDSSLSCVPCTTGVNCHAGCTVTSERVSAMLAMQKHLTSLSDKGKQEEEEELGDDHAEVPPPQGPRFQRTVEHRDHPGRKVWSMPLWHSSNDRAGRLAAPHGEHGWEAPVHEHRAPTVECPMGKCGPLQRAGVNVESWGGFRRVTPHGDDHWEEDAVKRFEKAGLSAGDAFRKEPPQNPSGVSLLPRGVRWGTADWGETKEKRVHGDLEREGVVNVRYWPFQDVRGDHGSHAHEMGGHEGATHDHEGVGGASHGGSGGVWWQEGGGRDGGDDLWSYLTIPDHDVPVQQVPEVRSRGVVTNMEHPMSPLLSDTF